MAESQVCPYGECGSLTKCGFQGKPFPKPPPNGVVVPCPGDGKKRLLWSCPACGSTNHAIAAFCRQCGNRAPTDLTLPATNGDGAWNVPSPWPAGAHPQDMPQLGAIGDLLISFQQDGGGVTVLFTRMADGVTEHSFPYPGAPGFFSSPVTVRDRVYGFLAGALWEYGLFDGAGFKSFPLPKFTPSPDCRPIHVATPEGDLLFMGATNAVCKVNVTGPQPAVGSYRVPLGPGDTIQSPVHVPGWGVIFTTLLGKIIVFPETDGNLGAAPKLVSSVLRDGPCLLSAPAVAPGAAGIVAELFEGDQLTRFFLTIGPNMAPVPKRPTGEMLHPDNRWLLRFPPFEGAFALARSWAVPNHVWFVNSHNPVCVNVTGVDLDPVRSVAVGGRVFVAAPNALVSFGVNAVAQQGTILHQFAGGTAGPALNRPLSRFGRVFIQKADGLISRGV